MGGPLTDTTGATTANLMVKFAAPDSILREPLCSLYPSERIPAWFADPSSMTYPIHTPAATWASAAFYHATGSDNPDVRNRIKEACNYHRLTDEWRRLEKEARPKVEQVKTTHYALPRLSKYALDTREQVTKAVGYFLKFACTFSTQDRKEYARNLVKRAADLSVEFDTGVAHRLEAEAGMAKLSSEWQRAFLERAYMAANEPELAAEFCKAATDTPPQDIPETAALLRKFDAFNKWALDDPLMVMSGDSPSTVRALLAEVIQAANGAWYKKSDITKVPTEVMHELLGTPLITSRKLCEEILKDTTKSAQFRELLSDYGVKPVEEAPKKRVDWAAEANG